MENELCKLYKETKSLDKVIQKIMTLSERDRFKEFCCFLIALINKKRIYDAYICIMKCNLHYSIVDIQQLVTLVNTLVSLKQNQIPSETMTVINHSIRILVELYNNIPSNRCIELEEYATTAYIELSNTDQGKKEEIDGLVNNKRYYKLQREQQMISQYNDMLKNVKEGKVSQHTTQSAIPKNIQHMLPQTSQQEEKHILQSDEAEDLKSKKLATTKIYPLTSSENKTSLNNFNLFKLYINKNRAKHITALAIIFIGTTIVYKSRQRMSV